MKVLLVHNYYGSEAVPFGAPPPWRGTRLPLPPCAGWLMISSLMWFMHTIPFR